MMNDQQLLAALKAYTTFGPAMVQRITGFSYQRALDALSRLEGEGVIQRDAASLQWKLTSP